MRLTHPPCGRSWKQAGGRSGHCGNCHETFYGITAFDGHYTLPDDDGPMLCREPVEVEGKWWLDDDGQWHRGARLTEEEKARIWG